jgi:hypothetical protein
VGIADDELHATQPARDQVLEKLPPMRFLLTQRDGYTQESTLAIGLHAHRQEHRSITHLPVDAHLLVLSIEVQTIPSTVIIRC